MKKFIYWLLVIHDQFFVQSFALINERKSFNDLENWEDYHWRPSNISRVCRISSRNGWYWSFIEIISFSFDINFIFDLEGKGTSLGRRFISKKWRSQRPLVYHMGCRFDTGQGQWSLKQRSDWGTEIDDFVRVIFRWFQLRIWETKRLNKRVVIGSFRAI